MLTVGLDVHLRTSSVYILDAAGQRRGSFTVHGGQAKLLERLRTLSEPFAICYEASCGYGQLHDQLRRIAQRVVVAHPGHLKLIHRSHRKNDRTDAQKLAKLLQLDLVPTVWVPPTQVRAWRRLIEHRMRVVNQQTRAKNGLRGLLRSLGVEAPARLWTRQGMTWLAQLALEHAVDALRRDQLMMELEQARRMIKRVEQELDRIARSQPAVTLLRSIPGVGPRTAEAVAAYIGDPHRFTRGKTIGSYFGLVPCQDQSAGTNRLGHITRQGPGTVRRLITEAAWQAIRRSASVKRFFERVQHDQPGRRKIALVATGHHLLRVMLSMLKSGEVWRETEDSGRRRSAA